MPCWSQPCQFRYSGRPVQSLWRWMVSQSAFARHKPDASAEDLWDLGNVHFKGGMFSNTTAALRALRMRAWDRECCANTYPGIFSPRALHILEKQGRGSEKDTQCADRVKFSKVPTCLRYIEVCRKILWILIFIFTPLIIFNKWLVGKEARQAPQNQTTESTIWKFFVLEITTSYF